MTTNRSRPGLARMLCELLADAGLDYIGLNENPRRELGPQLEAIRSAAGHIDIAPGVPLNRWLALSLQELADLKTRVAAEGQDWIGCRPHGIFISTFKEIGQGTLLPTRRDIPAIDVTGTLAIFGEARNARRPYYLVIGLVAKEAQASPDAAIVRAYAHPCVDWDHLTLVDSSLERETLAQILSCGRWLSRKLGVQVSVQKPLFDVGPGTADEAREICLPDFVLTAHGTDVRHSTVIIETMGYQDEAYRHRKARMRALFENVNRTIDGPPTPVIEHDRFRTNHAKDADDRLWSDIRWTITSAKPG